MRFRSGAPLFSSPRICLSISLIWALISLCHFFIISFSRSAGVSGFPEPPVPEEDEEPPEDDEKNENILRFHTCYNCWLVRSDCKS